MKQDFISRINAALVFIDKHLTEDLTLQSVSAVAFYSPFHFHRLFKLVTGEALNVYINRKRIERASLQLLLQKQSSITNIALECGFSSGASFSRTFRIIHKVSPVEYRKLHPLKLPSSLTEMRKIGQTNLITEEYLANILSLKHWTMEQSVIEVKEVGPLHIAYLTHIGVDRLELAFQRILKWAQTKDLLQPDIPLVRIFHDSFKVTAPGKVRMSIGVAVPDGLEVDGEMSLTNIPKAKCIVGRFEIHPVEFEKAWNATFLWMAENKFRKADGNPFELYRNNPSTHPENKCIVDLCIPIL